MKLALGTVQFGMDYGISNTNGQVSYGEIANILDYAKRNGINTLDTAQGYGESEKILGQFNLSDFRIITKLIGGGVLETSLKSLNVQSVYGLMFHREDEINDTTWKKFQTYKDEKLVEKIGVSVYSPQKLVEIVDRFAIDIVQLPLNLLDQRFLPILPKLKEKNIEVHTRSTFLQGLLLMDVKNVNEYFKPIEKVLSAILEPKLATALNFAKNIQEVDKMVIGVTSKKELEEIFLMYDKNVDKIDFSKLGINDEKFINPSKWSLK